jgi:acetoin utilization deacetylase AcuC-like enzyme
MASDATRGRLLLVGTGGEEHAHPGHPERPERLVAALAGVEDLHLGDDLVVLEAEAAPVEALTVVHHPAYLEALEGLCAAGGGALDPDTYARPASFDAARRATGGGLAAAEALRRGVAPVAFVAARPPGHHALADRGMGFCLVNNAAVVAATLAEGGDKVAVIDWDVHHGNGTEAIFWDDPRVLYASTHQAPHYPGTGAAEDVGGPGARGATVNVPLPAGATGDVVRRALDEVIVPAVAAFGPDWVLVSAGFDAHRDDPLASLALSAGDFAHLAATVGALAPPDRLLLFLEGGYDARALRHSVTAALLPLVGSGQEPAEPSTEGGPGLGQVRAAAEVQRRLAATG